MFNPTTLNFNHKIDEAVGYIDALKESIEKNEEKYTELYKAYPVVKWKNFLANVARYRQSLESMRYKRQNIKSEQVSSKMHKVTEILQLMHFEMKGWVDLYPAVFVVTDTTYGVSELVDIMQQIKNIIGDTDVWPVIKKRKRSRPIGRKRKETRVQRVEKHAHPGRSVRLKPGNVPENPLIISDRHFRIPVGSKIKIHPEPTDENELGEQITNIVMTKLQVLGVSDE